MYQHIFKGFVHKALLEIKCPKPSTHVYWFLAGELPDKHRPQCHAALLLAERDWLDFVSYCPGFPALLLRVVPDDYTDKVAAALAAMAPSNIRIDVVTPAGLPLFSPDLEGPPAPEPSTALTFGAYTRMISSPSTTIQP